MTSIFNTSSTSIQLTWEAVPSEHQNGLIQGYMVLYHQICSNDFFYIEVNCSSRSLEVKLLQEYTAYRFSLAAFNEKGTGIWSIPYVIFTEQAGTF